MRIPQPQVIISHTQPVLKPMLIGFAHLMSIAIWTVVIAQIGGGKSADISLNIKLTLQ